MQHGEVPATARPTPPCAAGAGATGRRRDGRRNRKRKRKRKGKGKGKGKSMAAEGNGGPRSRATPDPLLRSSALAADRGGPRRALQYDRATMNVPYEWQVGWRYTRSGRAGRRNGFISFISGVSMLGIALGVAALIIVLSVMNGFQKE
ncbi:MAG: hypothetical protein ABI696_17845, partial [Rubrivivax sp.]